MPPPSPQRRRHGQGLSSPHSRRDGISSFVGLFARLGQEESSTSVNVGSRRKQAPRIQSDARHLSVGTAAPPSAQRGEEAITPLWGDKTSGEDAIILGPFSQKPQNDKPLGLPEGEWCGAGARGGRAEAGAGRGRAPQSLGGDGHGGEDPEGIGTRGRTAAERPVRIADAAGLCAHCLKQKLVIQGLFLAPVEFLIAHVLHLYSCCCEKSYPTPEKSHFPPILCSILCNEETWPLKEKQQINSDLSLHTDHA